MAQNCWHISRGSRGCAINGFRPGKSARGESRESGTWNAGKQLRLAVKPRSSASRARSLVGASNLCRAERGARLEDVGDVRVGHRGVEAAGHRLQRDVPPEREAEGRLREHHAPGLAAADAA